MNPISFYEPQGSASLKCVLGDSQTKASKDRPAPASHPGDKGEGNVRRGSRCFGDAFQELLTQGTTRDKGAVCGWKQEVLHLHGHGQGSAQQCRLSGGINPAPEGCLMAWGGHQVVAQSAGWATCLSSPAWEGLVEPRLHLSIPGTVSKAPSSHSLTFLHCPWPTTL